MPKFLKPCLGPGQWVVQGEDGEPGLFTADPARVKRWADNGKAMLSAGLKIPVIWEHTLEPGDKSGLPLTDAELLRSMRDQDAILTKYNAGFVTDFVLNDDQLAFELDIPLEEDAEKVGTTVQAISPLIEDDFIDGDGRQWRDSICHVALTNKPVISQQGPFKRVAASLKSMRFVRLSRPWGGGKGGGGDDQDDAVDDAVDDDNDNDLQRGGDSDGDGQDDYDVDTFGGDDLDDVDDDMGSGGQPVSPGLVKALQMHGLIIPPDTTLDNLEQHLMTALHTSKATKALHKSEQAADSMQQGSAGQPGTMPTTGLKEEQQVALSKKRKPAVALTPEERSLAFEEALKRTKRSELKGRMDRLVSEGRLSRNRHGAMLRQLASARLSVAVDGTVADLSGLSSALDVAEDAPIGTHFTPDERAKKFDEHDNDRFFDGGVISKEKADAINDEVRKNTGRD